MSTVPQAAPLLAQQLLNALPQTQCTRCGYPDCAAYAGAIARNEAPINQCPPGGSEGIARLAAINGSPVIPLNPDFGHEGPRTIVFIDEDWCIGCTLCIKACPTDAIIGTNKRMHTVIEAHCTGCNLCLPVCPVDCMLVETVSGERTAWNAWSAEDASKARQRYESRQVRQAREAEEHAQALEAKARMKLADMASHSQHTDEAVLDQKRAVIQAVLAKARARQAGKAD